MGRFWEEHSHISHQTKTLPTKFSISVNLIIRKQQFNVNNYSSVIYILAISGTVYNICIIIRRTSPFSSSLFPARLSGLLFLRQAGALTTKLNYASLPISYRAQIAYLFLALFTDASFTVKLSTGLKKLLLSFLCTRRYMGGIKDDLFTFLAEIKSVSASAHTRNLLMLKPWVSSFADLYTVVSLYRAIVQNTSIYSLHN
jgi:hypothetical protein